MDIQQLRLFTSLCRHLHFGNAGVERHMSPSAVSRNIQRLEDTIGHKLLLRDNRSVSLTEQGVIFHRYAMDVLARWDALNLELGQTEGELTGRLTLFASVTASQSILPNVLSRFRQDYPGIHIQLETGYAVNALKRLFEGCDVVVAALPMMSPPVNLKSAASLSSSMSASSSACKENPLRHSLKRSSAAGTGK